MDVHSVFAGDSGADSGSVVDSGTGVSQGACGGKRKRRPENRIPTHIIPCLTHHTLPDTSYPAELEQLGHQMGLRLLEIGALRRLGALRAVDTKWHTRKSQNSCGSGCRVVTSVPTQLPVSCTDGHVNMRKDAPACEGAWQRRPSRAWTRMVHKRTSQGERSRPPLWGFGLQRYLQRIQSKQKLPKANITPKKYYPKKLTKIKAILVIVVKKLRLFW